MESCGKGLTTILLTPARCAASRACAAAASPAACFFSCCCRAVIAGARLHPAETALRRPRKATQLRGCWCCGGLTSRCMLQAAGDRDAELLPAGTQPLPTPLPSAAPLCVPRYRGTAGVLRAAVHPGELCVPPLDAAGALAVAVQHKHSCCCSARDLRGVTKTRTVVLPIRHVSGAPPSGLPCLLCIHQDVKQAGALFAGHSALDLPPSPDDCLLSSVLLWIRMWSKQTPSLEGTAPPTLAPSPTLETCSSSSSLKTMVRRPGAVQCARGSLLATLCMLLKASSGAGCKRAYFSWTQARNPTGNCHLSRIARTMVPHTACHDLLPPPQATCQSRFRRCQRELAYTPTCPSSRCAACSLKPITTIACTPCDSCPADSCPADHSRRALRTAVHLPRDAAHAGKLAH